MNPAGTGGLNAASGASSGGGSGARPGGSGGSSTSSGTTGGSFSGGSSSGGTGGVVAGSGGAATTAAGLSIPARGQVLSSQGLAQQLVVYDPGSMLRCGVASDPKYQAAVDGLGGVTWGYNVSLLEDQSKPRYLAGVEKLVMVRGDATNAGGTPTPVVEIVSADIVAVTDAAALFYSASHGLMIVAIEQGKPVFNCAIQLPGRVDQFFFHEGHLVVMTKAQNAKSSQLLHFNVQGTDLRFVEAIDLGQVSVLDSRRFNRKLVFYTTFDPDLGGNPSGGAASPAPVSTQQSRHRSLRVFELGDQLKEELYDTLVDTTESEAQLVSERVTKDMAIGTQISEARSFGTSIWASDHYFVVTETISKTFLGGWATNNYSVCTASHTTESPYLSCRTEYETRPNPDYVEPDNSGGDRACKGLTLSDCLVEVARVSNKTIQVPVGRKCESSVRVSWFCDAHEQRSTTYPTFRQEASTQLYIYEYTDAGFVRVDSRVHEVKNQGLDALSPDAKVDRVTTSAETFELAVPGAVQTLYFQNGFLYVISRGVLQVYAMGGGSIVRTATLPVVNETLQASLFSADRLFLSDFGWSGGDHSTLRVINLKNPAFPTQDGATHQLPGGHRSILASDFGIFTVGTVQTFMGQPVNALKLGLFSDPYAMETAYLVLGTDLKYTYLAPAEAQFFNGASQRMVLPYSGQDAQANSVLRVGLSHVAEGTIVSEGAVVLPELAQRVRPLRSADESYLTFATNSIEWLTPSNKEWKAEPVLEYFEPFAIYRRSKDSQYVELQRLGSRCRLYFADPGQINQREQGTYSAEFACVGYPQAYDHQLIFAPTKGVEFGDDHSLRALSEAEITDTKAKIAARQYCLLKLALVDAVSLDPDNLPPADQFTCLTPEEYFALRTRLHSGMP